MKERLLSLIVDLDLTESPWFSIAIGRSVTSAQCRLSDNQGGVNDLSRHSDGKLIGLGESPQSLLFWRFRQTLS